MAVRGTQALYGMRRAASFRLPAFFSTTAPTIRAPTRSFWGVLVPSSVIGGVAALALLDNRQTVCENPTVVAATAVEGLHPVASVKDLSVVLYQYEPCPFCNKVRAFLDYHKIPYTVVEVNPLFKTELKFSVYKKVPVAVVQGVQVNDSANIIKTLEALLPKQAAPAQQAQQAPAPSGGWWPFGSTPSSAAQPLPVSNAAEKEAEKKETEKWCSWVDDKLVHLLPANIYRTPSEALSSFDYLLEHGNFPSFQRDLARYVGAAAMHLLSKYKLNKKYGITAPREQLYEAVNEWIDNIGDKAFQGGSSPSMADLSVFGVLRSIEGYGVFKEVQSNSRVGPWYSRMEKAVGESSRVADAAATSAKV